MKKWRYFPLLVKVNVLASLDIMAKISFAKCSKNALILIGTTHVPLDLVRLFYNRKDRLLVRHSFSRAVISVDDLIILLSFRKVSIRKLTINIRNWYDERDVRRIAEGVKAVKEFVKIDTVVFECVEDLPAVLDDALKICDPKFLEKLKLPKMIKLDVLQNIARTPQWKQCKQLELVTHRYLGSTLSLASLDFNDFSHFSWVNIEVSGISPDDAWNVMKCYQHIRQPASFNIITSIISITQRRIKEKILTEMPGRWFTAPGIEMYTRCLAIPEHPNLYFMIFVSGTMFGGGVQEKSRVEYFHGDLETNTIYVDL